MKKYILDLRVVCLQHFNDKYVLLKLSSDEKLPAMQPGQFVEVRVDSSPSTFLRRPISINLVDYDRNELWLLVAVVGEGTRHIASLQEGDTLNCILPLGKGFTMPKTKDDKWLLIGGGVGVAPLLYFGQEIVRMGASPTFLLGARSQKDLLELGDFRKLGTVLITTEDGTAGEKGFVTNHSIFQREQFDQIATCGPSPMMKAVARMANELGIHCEASLENMMACGVGACLCCVEKTTEGNLCVCKEGPVFDVKRLLW